MTSTTQHPDQKLVYALFALMAVFFIFNGIVSDGFGGGADSITHFQIARFSWTHHHLFMHQWGKPIFNIIASPFAQLGFKGVVYFNIGLILWGAWLAWLIAKRMLDKNAWLVPFFVLLSPVVLENSVSGLTEMICSLFLIGYIYLHLTDKIAWGALLLSFMPYARSEGFVIIAVIALYYLFSKKWKYLPLLLVGSIVFDIAGYLHTGKLLWIFDSNPYVNSTFSAVYGKGSFFHFFIWGVPTFGISFLLSILGTVVLAKKVPAAIWKRTNDVHADFWVWLVMGTGWGYFAAHTFLWWQGMWASLGLVRVMFVVLVPMVLIAVYGFNYLSDRIKNPKTANIILYTFMAITTIGPFLWLKFPIPPGTEELVNIKAAEYIKENIPVEKTKFYTAHPYMNFRLGLDPYNKEEYEPLYSYKTAQVGDYIVWDGHFGPNEHQVPLNTFLNDSTHYQFIQNWRPERTFITLNGFPYEIVMFRKISE